MIGEVSKILMAFRQCFRRAASFHWFVTFVFGFLIRLDHHGVTSMIRWMGLNPNLYVTSLNFFRASSWNLADIQRRWLEIISARCPLVTVGGAYLMVGDGIKIAKEAEKMPGVKKLHQESDNSGKAPYIFGHHFGVLGLLVGNAQKKFCVPVMAEIQEGMEQIRKFQGKGFPVQGSREQVTLVTMMASMVNRLASHLNKRCIAVLDGFYAVGPTFLGVKDLLDATGNRLLHVITRAKKNIVAYQDPPPQTGKRGRPPMYGRKLKLIDLFHLRAEDFQQATITTYGQRKTISFLCLDLIWRPIKAKVRFVLVVDGKNRFILMCSDLGLAPLEIIQAYSYRFKIEVTFKMMKHLVGAFCYHFWTVAWPKIGKRTATDLATVTSDISQRLIALAINAIEGFVHLGCIATGILQILALNNDRMIWKKYRGWLRTYSSEVPSEETVRSVIQENFYHNFHDFHNTAIYQIIMSKSRGALASKDGNAA
ncbi:hypothetical protein SY88_02810 [Clostridiales bacterium PH28_bin88]|nr:hypothetical protein SY88_02810 [Clostridiales bacterium PH28_bin88]